MIQSLAARLAKPKRLYVRLGPVRLWVADIFALRSLIESRLGAVDMRVNRVGARNTVQTIDEWRDVRVMRLTFRTPMPQRFSLEITSVAVLIKAQSDAATADLVREVRDFLVALRTPFYWVHSQTLTVLIGIVLGAGVAFLPSVYGALLGPVGYVYGLLKRPFGSLIAFRTPEQGVPERFYHAKEIGLHVVAILALFGVLFLILRWLTP